MADGLMNSLKALKDKLSLLETNADIVETTNEASGNLIKNALPYQERIENKLSELQETQNTKIVINAGGKSYIVSKNLIENSKFYTILKDLLNVAINESSNEIFYDCSYNMFKYIIVLLRVFQNGASSCNYNKEKKYTLRITNNSDKNVIKEIIKNVFFTDYETLLEIIEIKYKSEKEEIPLEIVPAVPEANVNNYDYGGADAAYDNNRAYDY